MSFISPKVRGEAANIAKLLARKLDVVGLLTVEMFVTKEGVIFINEIAPRPHNSGHWTIEGCNRSQFEMHIRAICNLELHQPKALFQYVRIDNLIGTCASKANKALKDPDVHVHFYGKKEWRDGRKMGHVTSCTHP